MEQPLSSVLSPLVPRGERKGELDAPGEVQVRGDKKTSRTSDHETGQTNGDKRMGTNELISDRHSSVPHSFVQTADVSVSVSFPKFVLATVLIGKWSSPSRLRMH